MKCVLPYSNQERGPCTPRGQESRAGAGVMSAGDSDLRSENKRAGPAPCCRLPWVSQQGQCWRARLGSHKRESWQADQPESTNSTND